jgi:hypothetical protein
MIRETFMSEHSHPERSGYASARFRPSSSGPDEINRARDAAEALFAPKEPIADPSSSKETEAAQRDMRKPRILRAVTAKQAIVQVPVVETTKRPLQRKARTPGKRVPVSHLARVRSWLKYGMTIAQAADVYGVGVSEIERILQKA